MNNAFAKKRFWGPVPHYPKVENYRPPNYEFMVVAGPCSVESADQISQVAQELARNGVKWLRGGVFRAGTYPGPRFGLQEPLMASMALAAKENGMRCVMEVLDYSDDALQLYHKYADAFQVGARQMQNYTLLRKLGATGRPVFLKRGVGSKLDEFLGAAEHVLQSGKGEVVLIERGSSTYHDHVRWDLSISMIPAVQALTRIPIIVDASHGTGRRDLVEPMTLAGVAAGADGYLIEVHPDPDKSLSDADQAFPLGEFQRLKTRVDDLRIAMTKRGNI